MALKGELDAEHYKTLGPTQLLAERGRDIVVINPGSAFLRIGLCSQKEPLLIPHCIARYAPELARKRQKVRGGIHEVEGAAVLDRRRSSSEAGTSQEKGVLCQHIVANLNIAPGWLQAASAKASSGLKLIPEAEDTSFRWTETRVTSPPNAGVKLDQQMLPGPSAKEQVSNEGKDVLNGATSNGVELDTKGFHGQLVSNPPDKPRDSDGRADRPVPEQRPGNPDESSHPENSNRGGDGQLQIGAREGDPSDSPQQTAPQPGGREADAASTGQIGDAGISGRVEHRRWICGEEALHIASSDPYVLRRPIRRGRLNVSRSYPLQQVLTDLVAIWQWALTDRLNLSLADRRSMSAVLVVSETLNPRESKELLSVLLKDLQFESTVLHQESLAALFGNNMTSACIVSLGAQVCTVTCVEEGTVLPTSRVSLPYGGEDVSRALLWVQQKYVCAWPYGACDPLADVQDRLLLEALKEEHCFFGEGGHVAPAEFSVREKGASTEHYQTPLIGSPNLAPVGLFFPRLLSPEEYPPPDESALSEDNDELLDDSSLAEPGRRVCEPGGSPLLAFQQGAGGGPAALEGIDVAIVRSILSTYSADLQKKLFSSIQLIGGGARMAGVVDFVEERVLHAIPGHIDADTVEVVKNRGDPRTIAWRGGCILGVLDYSDAWIQREDWIDGGARAGTGRKYKDTNNLGTQTFWYCSIAE